MVFGLVVLAKVGHVMCLGCGLSVSKSAPTAPLISIGPLNLKIRECCD